MKPVQILYPEVNISNHRLAIQFEALGPLDPREPSNEYWQAKQELWGVSEGEARTRLCMNCAHYDNSEEVMLALEAQEPLDLTLVNPDLVNVPGDLSACCTRWLITCTAMRTCDAWEAPWEDADNANVLFVSPEEELSMDVERMLKEVVGESLNSDLA